MADESSRSCYYHVGTHLEALQLLVVAVAVVATVHSHAAHSREVVAEALHLLVNLLRQLSCWAHYYAVDGIGRIVALVEF